MQKKRPNYIEGVGWRYETEQNANDAIALTDTTMSAPIW